MALPGHVGGHRRFGVPRRRPLLPAATPRRRNDRPSHPIHRDPGSAHDQCGTRLTGVGTTKATTRLQDLRLYVSNVRLVRRDGSSVKLQLRRNDAWNLTRGGQAVTLIDLENGTSGCAGAARMNTVITGTVPKGTYTGITYTLGMPLALNHTDPTSSPAPLNLIAMTWSWQSGRKFTQIELDAPSARGVTGPDFFVHLGSTGCKAFRPEPTR